MQKADDPIASSASVLINIAFTKCTNKSKKAKNPRITDDCKTAIKQRNGALRQFNNRPAHDNLSNKRFFFMQKLVVQLKNQRKNLGNSMFLD